MTVDVSPTLDEKTYCYRHPTIETSLRCNKCGNYICSKCAVLTPVGYRCPDCVRQQQDVFFTVKPVDYVVAGIVSFVLGLAAIFILSRLNFLLITLIVSLPVGGLISEIVFRAMGRRRGRYTFIIVPVAIVLGGVAANFQGIQLIFYYGAGYQLLITPVIATLAIAAAAAVRFRLGK